MFAALPPLLLLLQLLAPAVGAPPPLPAPPVGAFSCSAAWPDECPPGGLPGDAACRPYAAPPPGGDLLAARAALAAAVFGGDGSLPSAGADAELPLPGGSTLTNRGCWCSTLGRCAASACAWESNATAVVFTVRAPFANGSGALVVNSTAFWTRDTSGVAPSSYIGPDGPPAFAPFPSPPPAAPTGTLVIWHNGHNSPCNISGGDPDYDGTVDWLNQLGYDVLNLHMRGWLRARRRALFLPQPAPPLTPPAAAAAAQPPTRSTARRCRRRCSPATTAR